MAGEPQEQESADASPTGALDREAALARLGGDLDLLREVAQTFRLEGPRLLGLIRAAAAAGDAHAMRRAAHTLRGSASVFAAESVVAGARQVEEVGISGRMDEAPAAVAALAVRLDEFLASLAAVNPDPTAKEGA